MHDKDYLNQSNLQKKIISSCVTLECVHMNVFAGMMRNMKWAGDTENTKVYIFDIKNPSSDGAPAAVFEAPPMFAYHFINAYEEPSSTGNGKFDIVVDFAGYDTLDILKGDHAYALLSNIMDPELRKLQARDGRHYRLRLPMPPKGSKAPTAPVFVKHSILVAKDKTGREFTYEMPRVSPKQKTFKHR
jgi:Retinal pigment epithelial membrane protein